MRGRRGRRASAALIRDPHRSPVRVRERRRRLGITEDVLGEGEQGAQATG